MRCSWTSATTAVAAAVLLASTLRTNPLVLAILVGFAAALGTVVVCAVRRSGDGDDVGAGAVGAGTRLGLLVVASLQLMTVSVSLWFACAVLVVATAPSVRPVLVALLTLGAADPAADDLGDLSDDDLLQLWRASAQMLQDPLQPTVRCRLVARRALYLEELERRHPDRMRAWLVAELRNDPS